MIIEPRSAWGAKPPKVARPLEKPSDFRGVAIHWFGSPKASKLHGGCDNVLRAVQNIHMSPGGLGAAEGGNDIGYNYAVCPHGTIYMCRGLRRSGANGTSVANANYLAIVYMGGTGDPFTLPAKKSISELIAHLQKRGVGLQVRKHGEFVQTSCPGPAVTAWVDAKGYNMPVDSARLRVDVVADSFRLDHQDWDNKAVQTRIFRALKNGETVKIEKSKG